MPDTTRSNGSSNSVSVARMYTVGGRPADGVRRNSPHPRLDFADTEDVEQCPGCADAALVPVRGHYRYLSQLGQRLDNGPEARSVYAVVVRNKYSQCTKAPAKRTSACTWDCPWTRPGRNRSRSCGPRSSEPDSSSVASLPPAVLTPIAWETVVMPRGHDLRDPVALVPKRERHRIPGFRVLIHRNLLTEELVGHTGPPREPNFHRKANTGIIPSPCLL